MISLHSLVFGGSVPRGAFLVGFLSEHWGVPTAFVVMGAAGVVGTCALALGWRKRQRRTPERPSLSSA